VALAAVVPVAALALAGVRVRRVLALLQLPPPRGGIDLLALVSLAAAVGLLGLAAAQPAVARDVHEQERTDVQVLFVVDVSGSMAASATAESPTRLDRAIADAEKLRAAIPNVEAGVATLTDRVLPNLLPVADVPTFDATLERALGIEAPPPETSAVTATSYAALTQLATGNYYTAPKRIAVVLTDGESATFSPGDVARTLSRAPGVSLITVRVWADDESIFLPSGRIDPGYRPDPQGATTLRELADATNGSTFEESQLGRAAAALRERVGSGPTQRTTAVERSALPIAPYVALVALVPLAVLALRRARRLRASA